MPSARRGSAVKLWTVGDPEPRLSDAAVRFGCSSTRTGKRWLTTSPTSGTEVWNRRSELLSTCGDTNRMVGLTFSLFGRRQNPRQMGSRDKAFRFWEIESGHELSPLSIEKVEWGFVAAIAPDGRLRRPVDANCSASGIWRHENRYATSPPR